jgi:hypothetical protein
MRLYALAHVTHASKMSLGVGPLKLNYFSFLTKIPNGGRISIFALSLLQTINPFTFTRTKQCLRVKFCLILFNKYNKKIPIKIIKKLLLITKCFMFLYKPNLSRSFLNFTFVNVRSLIFLSNK